MTKTKTRLSKLLLAAFLAAAVVTAWAFALFSAPITAMAADTYSVTFGVDPIWNEGTISATQDGVPIPSGTFVPSGKTVVFTATPNAGYRVREWGDNLTGMIMKSDTTHTVTNLADGYFVYVAFEEGEAEPQVKEVAFTAEQTGGASGTMDSAGIVLTFHMDVTGLTADDITITDGTGAVVVGEFTGAGVVWMLELISVTAEGTVTVAVSDFGTYEVITPPQTVTVYKKAGGGVNPNAQTPVIDIQPQDASVNKGGAVTLTVTAAAGEEDMLSCQWYANLANGNGGGTAIDGATGSEYRPSTENTGTAYYYCVITNGAGGPAAVSRAAKVTVTETTETSGGGNNGGLSGGAVAGIVMTVIAVLGGGGLAAWFVIKKRKAV